MHSPRNSSQMWFIFFLLLLVLVTFQAYPEIVHFTQPNDLLLVVKPSGFFDQSYPLCADSFSRRLGKRVCQQLGYRKLRKVSYVELERGPTINIHCGISLCFTYEVYGCATGVRLHCASNKQYAVDLWRGSFCGSEEVRCGNSEQCVAREFVCDYELDCDNKADEDNCPDWLTNFDFEGNFKISNGAVEKWTHIPHEQACAKRCLEAENDSCFTFSYSPTNRVCLLAGRVFHTTFKPNPNAFLYKKSSAKDSVSFRLNRFILEMKKRHQWAPLCMDNETELTAHIVCRHFGFREHDGGKSAAVEGKFWTVNCLEMADCYRPPIHFCNQPLQCSSCQSDELPCSDGYCISKSKICDHYNDCADGSDETFCDEIIWHISSDNELLIFHDGQWKNVCNESIHKADKLAICVMAREKSTDVMPNSVENSDKMGWKLECGGMRCTIIGKMKCRHGFARISCPQHTEQEICGKRYMDTIARDPRKHRYARVVGGFETLPGAYPWTASIRIRNKQIHHCGASVLNSRYLITAAHCFDENRDVNYYEAVTGEWDLSVDEGTEQTFAIVSIIPYPGYQDLFADDIALVEVDGDIIFDSYTQSICLPVKNFTYNTGMKCIVSGWGSLGEWSDFPEKLQAATLPVLSREKCIKLSSAYESMSRSSFCAGYLSGGIDSCQGDSGGPFACQVNGLFYLAGVISWGDGCGERKHPGIYTMTAPYVQWVQEVMNRTTT